jgi:DNA-binding NtrC family response regulator
VGFLTSALVGAGYRVTAVMGVGQAVELLGQGHWHFTAAVLGAGTEAGQRVLESVRARQPLLPLLVTGATAIAANGPSTRFLPKPFRTDELLDAVRQVVGDD